MSYMSLISYVGWISPAAGQIKVNTDGSLIVPAHGPSSGGAAAVIRNEQAAWAAGTTKKLFGVSVAAAKLWTIFDGSSLAWEWAFAKSFLNSMPRQFYL